MPGPRTPLRPVAAAFALALCWLPARTARAQDDPDAAGLARGGAVVAAPDAGSAFIWNPALVPPGLRGLRLYGDLRVDARRVTSRVWGQDPDRTAFAPLEPRVLPLIAAQGGLGGFHLTAGAWYRVRSDERAWFPGQNPEPDPLVPSAYDKHRYGALRYRRTTHTFGLSLAWQPRPWVAVGLSALGRWIRWSHERLLWTGTADNVDPSLNVTADDLEYAVSLRTRFVPEGRVGVFFRPTRFLRLGLSFALPGEAHLRGHATLADQPSGRVVPLVTRADADLRLRLPWSLRGAVGVDVSRVSLDAQIQLEQAPSPGVPVVDTTGLLIRRTTGIDLIPINAVPLGWQYQRRLELGLGVLVRALPWLDLAAGYRFTQSDLASAWHTAAAVSPDRHLLSVGVGVRLGRLRLDLAYARAWAVGRRGPGRALASNPATPSAAAPIGDERQTRNGDLVSFTLSLELDYLP